MPGEAEIEGTMKPYYQDKWVTKQVNSYWCKLFIAGDYQSIITICRQFCFDISFCVTVSRTTYVYKGGVEEGVEIGLINYARFPKISRKLINIASKLAEIIAKHEGQYSYSILTPDKSIWVSRREDAINFK